MCTRKIQIKNKLERDYYQIGKIFRFQNIISAKTDKSLKGVVDTDQDEQTVFFHIYSNSGKKVTEFLDYNSILYRMLGNVILFASGSEFLVCKREIIGEALHIYLREICLGFSKSVVLWCDDKLASNEYFKYHRWLRMKNIDDEDDMTAHVHKSNSSVAKAYIKSDFFKLSVAMCKSFRFLQSAERANENIVRFGADRKVIPESMAGARLLKEFKEVIQSFDTTMTTNKLESGIYINDKKANEEQVKKAFIEEDGNKNLLLDMVGKRVKVMMAKTQQDQFASFIRAKVHNNQFDLNFGISLKPSRE